MHDLDVKLLEAGKAGYKGVEVFWEDLVYAAKKITPGSDEKDEAAMLKAAQHARDLCDQNGLSVLVLQPFINYEGILDQAQHDELIVKLKLWFKVIKVLGTDMIQIPSQVWAATGACVADSNLFADELRRDNRRHYENCIRSEGSGRVGAARKPACTVCIRGLVMGSIPRPVWLSIHSPYFC